MKKNINDLECQSIKSMQRTDQANYFKYYRLRKITTELENSKYLSEDFIASINAVISDNEQDDVKMSTKRKKEESKYKTNYTKLLIITCSLKDAETPKSLRSSDYSKSQEYLRTANSLENIRNNRI